MAPGSNTQSGHHIWSAITGSNQGSFDMPKFSKQGPQTRARSRSNNIPIQNIHSKKGAKCSTTVTKTTATFTSTTTSTTKAVTPPATKSGIIMNKETKQVGPPESLHEDIRQRLSMEREDKLGELEAKRDAVIDRLQSLEGKLDTIEAVKDDMRTEMEQLEDLERRNPEAAARSRELLADEISHDHIGQSRAEITEAINSAEAEDRDLEEAMMTVHADEDADGSSDYEAGGKADDEEAGDEEAEEEPGHVEEGYDDREEQEHEDGSKSGAPKNVDQAATENRDTAHGTTNFFFFSRTARAPCGRSPQCSQKISR